MQRNQHTFPWDESVLSRLIYWLEQQDFFIFFHSNRPEDRHSQFEAVAAIGKRDEIRLKNHSNPFEALQKFRKNLGDSVFGYFSYDLKNPIFNLDSSNFDGLDFDDLRFFQAEKILKIQDNQLHFEYLNDEASKDYQEILKTVIDKKRISKIKIQSRISPETYMQRVNTLKKHIQRGDVYEANFCQEFYGQIDDLPLATTYEKLNQISQAPFSVMMKLENQILISASPERFVQRIGSTVISQPIKGTAKRSQDPTLDKQLKTNLARNEKERAENIMIVDLVRNDLAKIAKRGSVSVTELCKIYSFKQVHQMISTIQAEVEDRVPSEKIIEDLFPMGSMTGAPKKSALQIIENLEGHKRGLYSGTVGYIDKNGDFDFNVVIRSILYNSSNKYFSYSVGSAITDKAIAEQEFEECQIKAAAMKDVLQGNV